MKPIYLRYFYSNHEDKTDIPDGTEIFDDDLWDIASHIFNLDLQVMVKRYKESIILYVDQGPSAFKQR